MRGVIVGELSAKDNVGGEILFCTLKWDYVLCNFILAIVNLNYTHIYLMFVYCIGLDVREDLIVPILPFVLSIKTFHIIFI